MRSLFLLSVKNLFRRKSRTILNGLVMLLASFVMLVGLAYGGSVQVQMTSSMVDSLTANLQILPNGSSTSILDVPKSDAPKISGVSSTMQKLGKIEGVQAVTPFMRVGAVLASDKTTGVQVVGIEPDSLQKVLPGLQLKNGQFPSGNQIVLSQSTANSLNVKVGDTVKVIAGTGRDVVTKELKISGIMDAGGMNMFVGSSVYVPLDIARDLLHADADQASSLAIRTASNNDPTQVATQINALFGLQAAGLKAYTWDQVGKLLNEIVMGSQLTIQATNWIIFLVIILGVVNIKTMDVVERTREIGMMRSVGLQPRQVVLLYLLEGGVLGLGCAVVGGLLGVILILVMGHVGIPAIGDGMKFMFGGDRLYLTQGFTIGQVVKVLVVITALSVIGSFFPAFRGSRRPIVQLLRNL